MNKSTYDFCNFAEKYNEKMNMWEEVMVAIKSGQLYFYEKKNSPKNNFTDRFKPKLDTFSLDHCQTKIFREHQINHQIKPNILMLYIDNITLIFSFKNEMQMHICDEAIKSHSSKKSNGHLNHSQLSHRTIKAVQTQVFPQINMNRSQNQSQSQDNLKQLNKNLSTHCLIHGPKIDYMKKSLKEENKPLNSLISDLLFSSDKNMTLKSKANDKDEETNKVIFNKKNKLNQIIQLSLKKTSDDLLSSSMSFISSLKSPSLNSQITSLKPLQYDLEGSVDEGLINNSFFNTSLNNCNSFSKSNQVFSITQQLNLQSQSLSFLPSGNDKIQSIVNRIENYELYIYDSYIIKKLIKVNSLTKEDFGTIYSSLNNDCLKGRILIEMIAFCSKQKLSHLIQQKQNEERIEMLITEVFNSFLGNNSDSIDLYGKILPGELNDIFKIKVLLDIKQRISFPNLFVVMEYKNRIYFNDNLDINFSNPSPFVDQDIKYISPYLLLKWSRYTSELNHAKAASFQTMTNIKRMPINPQLSSERLSQDYKEMKLYKEMESMTDETRIELVMEIYQLIYHKKYELSLKLCDYYVQKFTDSIFLNPIVYLILLEIYNQTIGIDLAKLFFDKCSLILNWLYPNNSCHLIVDVYYTYSLMLMKQSENYINSNMKYISDIIIRSKDLAEVFYNSSNEKFIKINLQYHLFNYLYRRIKLPVDEVISSICLMESADFSIKEIYLQLFIDCLEGDLDNRIMKLNLVQVLSSMRKESSMTK